VAPFVLAQLSDPHIVPRGALAYGHIDSAAALRAAVAHVEAFRPAVGFAMVTGDLVDAATPDEYDHLLELLAPLTMPLAVLPGNHDDREHLRHAFPEQFAGCGARLCRAIDAGPLRLVLLDTHVPGEPGGAVGGQQLAWLDDELASHADRPTVVALHHPPFRTGLVAMDAMGLTDADALATVIGRHRHVERVVCGHLHRPITTRFAGTVAMTAPSTSHQLILALDPDAPIGYTGEPAAVLIHAWDPDAGLRSHVSLVGDFGEEHVFSWD
jgi:3',5'-cyclic AMP phosphodiesterase CpdA